METGDNQKKQEKEMEGKRTLGLRDCMDVCDVTICMGTDIKEASPSSAGTE